ncbi:potassium transporter KefC [Ectothiorhodospiraceae bacterium BW-2]|nr:potassium transporter KefC [Ectothiorhodospiraceae bacterium BW-2]
MLSSYLNDIVFMLLGAVVAVPLFQLLRFGVVPGFLLAGVLVGPSGLGLISHIDEIAHLAEIGVVFLLFVIGIELKPSRLWMMRRLVFGLGSLQIILSGTLISLVGYYIFGLSLRAAILVGPVLALSSTAFVLQLLSENRQLTSSYGRSSFSILLMQDLAVVPLLALVPLLAMPEMSIGTNVSLAMFKSILILVLVILLGKNLLNPLFNYIAKIKNDDIFTASAVVLVLGTALLTEHLGMSMAMGAFIAGLLISGSDYRHQVLAEIHPFRGLLLGLFFMSMGMSLNLQLLFSTPGTALMLLLVLLLIKIAVLLPLALLFGCGRRNSMAIALILAQGGEFALVLFSLAQQAALFSEITFQYLLLIVLLSMLITPLLFYGVQQVLRLNPSPSSTAHQAALTLNSANDDTQTADATPPVVIAGYGRVGHRIGEILASMNQPYVALDADAELVQAERARSQPVYFGDVGKPEVLKSAGAEYATIFILTLNNPETTQALVRSLRRINPECLIYARGHSLIDCKTLRRLGATAAVSENIEASLELTRYALQGAGIESEQVDEVLINFRTTYHKQINTI